MALAEAVPAGSSASSGKPSTPEASQEAGTPLVLHRLRTSEDVARSAAPVAGWVYDTGPRYFDFLFGNEDSARQVLARWFARESSEFDGHWCRLLNVGSTAVGCAIVLPAAEVQQRRRTDTLELIKGCEAAERSSLLVKLGSLRGELETPLDGLYIRCFSLDRASRGLGYGRKFLQLLIDEAASAGVSRLCLDVEADNVPAVSLYESLGFRITSQSRLSALEMTVNAMTLVLAEE